MHRTKNCRQMYKHIQWTKKRGFRPYTHQANKNLHTAISVNKPKLPVTKHEQILILAHMYDASSYTANTKTYKGSGHVSCIVMGRWCKTHKGSWQVRSVVTGRCCITQKGSWHVSSVMMGRCCKTHRFTASHMSAVL